MQNEIIADDDDFIEDPEAVDTRTLEEKPFEYRTFIGRVHKKLETYCLPLPVLGFNSSKYDLP